MNNKICAIQQLTSANCPLHCNYCYIPKTPYMKEYNERIEQQMKDSPVLLPDSIRPNIKYLSLWGTEPLVTIDVFTDNFKSYINSYPNLKNISFSTSLVLGIDKLVRFIKESSKHNLNLDIQISIDGPEFITDINRFKGASELIPNNLIKCIEQLQDKKYRCKFRWKATLTMDNLREMVSSKDKFDEYFKYFKSISDRFDDVNTNPNLSLNRSYFPTLMVPGTYTKEDGMIFAEFQKMLVDNNEYSTYDYRLKRLFDFEKDLTNKRTMFTCSGGDTQYGLDDEGNLHPCHRTFYLNDVKYLSFLNNEFDIDNWDVANETQGTLDVVNRFITKDDFDRVELVLRGYHDYWSHSIHTTIVLLKELAIAGQVSKEYLTNDILCYILAIYVHTAFSCPVENILNNGTPYITTISELRLLGNGAMKQLLRRYHDYV